MEPNIVERAAQMFPQLTPAQIDRISSIGHRRDVRAGEVLFDVGEQNTRFFVVLSGAIDVVRPIGDREEPVIVHRPRRVHRRDQHALGAAQPGARARAASDGAVIAVDRDDLRTLVQRDSGAERDPHARLHPAGAWR